MSLDAKQLSTEIIARFDELNENFDPNNLPDYLDEMSKVINKYLMDFADVSIVWKAQTTTTPPVQDAIQATTGKLLGVAISMKKSDCQNADPADSPRQLKNLFSNKISIAMSAATVTALKGTPYSQATKYTLGDIVTKETSYYQCIVHETPAGSSWKEEDWNEIRTYNPLESWNIVSVPLSTADPSYPTKLYNKWR